MIEYSLWEIKYAASSSFIISPYFLWHIKTKTQLIINNLNLSFEVGSKNQKVLTMKSSNLNLNLTKAGSQTQVAEVG